MASKIYHKPYFSGDIIDIWKKVMNPKKIITPLFAIDQLIFPICSCIRIKLPFAFQYKAKIQKNGDRRAKTCRPQYFSSGYVLKILFVLLKF